jgi:hypothetical protein
VPLSPPPFPVTQFLVQWSRSSSFGDLPGPPVGAWSDAPALAVSATDGPAAGLTIVTPAPLSGAGTAGTSSSVGATVWRLPGVPGVSGSVVIALAQPLGQDATLVLPLGGLEARAEYFVRASCNNPVFRVGEGVGPLAVSVPPSMAPLPPSISGISVTAPTLPCAGGQAIIVRGRARPRSRFCAQYRVRSHGRFRAPDRGRSPSRFPRTVSCVSSASYRLSHTVSRPLTLTSPHTVSCPLTFKRPPPCKRTTQLCPHVCRASRPPRDHQVTGDRLGRVGDDSITLTLASPGSTFTTQACVVEVEQTQARCSSPPGVGVVLTATLVSRGAPSDSFSTPGLAYAPPVVLDVQAASTATSGGVVRVLGRNFGPAALNAVDAVTYVPVGVPGVRPRHARCNVTVSDTELTCWTSGGVGAKVGAAPVSGALWLMVACRVVTVGHGFDGDLIQRARSLAA